jgi:hypothetical protein
MATLTTKTGLNQAETVHAGLNAAVCRVSISATTSAGDVLRIGRLPHRAIPLDVVFYPGAAFVDNGIHKFGLSGTDACFLASDSYSLAFGAANGAGTRANVSPVGLEAYLSRSDASPARYTYITHTPTAVLSVGHYGTLVVFYKMPGQSL